LGLTSRHITIEEGEDRIEVIGGLDENGYASNIALYVNGRLQDDLYSRPKDGIFGCRILLNGNLKRDNDDVQVKVQLRTHFFMRPEYTFCLDDVVIYIKKGTWGGM